MLTVDVPVYVSDLTRDAYGIRVDCDAQSSDGSFVATGRTFFVETSVYQKYSSEMNGLYGPDDNVEIVPGELSTLENGEPLQVYVLQNEGYHIDGWVRGSCDMFILHGTPSNTGLPYVSVDYCDPSPGKYDEIAACAWPGSDLVTSVDFVRPGFNEDGSLAPLPGVDE